MTVYICAYVREMTIYICAYVREMTVYICAYVREMTVFEWKTYELQLLSQQDVIYHETHLSYTSLIYLSWCQFGELLLEVVGTPAFC